MEGAVFFPGGAAFLERRGETNVFGVNKKAPKLSLRGFAPQQGLEPWTYGLTVRRSNQLSY